MSSVFRGSSALRGSSILLSASVPSPERSERYRRIPDCQLHIEEGIISLSRAVFANGGRLVFGGHPTVVPLVSMVAAEYVVVRQLESQEPLQTPVVVYQSDAYESAITDPERRMVAMGFADERLVPAVNGERFDPQLRSEPQCQRSLHKLRSLMIEEGNPIAQVCMGGMEGVEREFETFIELRPRRPAWLWATTGGVTALLAERYRGRPGVQIVDAEFLGKLKQRVAGEAADASVQEAGDLPAVVPYPYVMQLMLDELTRK